MVVHERCIEFVILSIYLLSAMVLMEAARGRRCCLRRKELKPNFHSFGHKT
jgi:hypothetical protein